MLSSGRVFAWGLQLANRAEVVGSAGRFRGTFVSVNRMLTRYPIRPTVNDPCHFTRSANDWLAGTGEMILQLGMPELVGGADGTQQPEPVGVIEEPHQPPRQPPGNG